MAPRLVTEWKAGHSLNSGSVEGRQVCVESAVLIVRWLTVGDLADVQRAIATWQVNR